MDKIRNCLIEETNQNELMNKKHKKVCRFLNYIKNSLLYSSTFASLVGIPIEITNSTIRLKICVIIASIKKYKSIIIKNRKKHDKIVVLPKSKLNRVEVLISRVLIVSNINHDEFVLIKNLLKEFYDMKEEIKNSNDK